MSGAEMSIESKRAAAALRESEEHYRAVAEAATDAIVTIDSDSAILIVNPATERIFGYTTDELIGQPLTMLMPEVLRHLHKAGIRRYLETGRKHIHWSAVQLPGLQCAASSRPSRRPPTTISRATSENVLCQATSARLRWIS